MEQIDDVRILKEKILKIDSIFTLIAEKQSRIKTLETKHKKETKEINILRSKNNELLTQLETTQKLYEQNVLDSSKKIQKLQKENKEKVKNIRRKYIYYQKNYSKKTKQFQKNTEVKHTREVQILKKIIKKLKSKLAILNSSGKNTGKEIKVLQNILIQPVKVQTCELETQTEDDTKMEDYCINAMLKEMMYLPDLMNPFQESPPTILRSIQTQTTRSTVTRPVQTCQQTSAVGLQCNLAKNNHVQSLVAFIEKEKENAQRDMKSFSIQTDYCNSLENKSSQTSSTCMATTESQTSGLGIIKEKKITLKSAVATLKRSKQSFTISNGMLLHYSKQPSNGNPGRLTNEALVAKSVFRRLAKYIDTQYGSLDTRKRRRMSNILCETKQLERSRELMKLYRSGMIFHGNSDTESSGYDSRTRRKLLHDGDIDCKTLSGDSGIVSEVEPIAEVSEQDVSSVLDEVLVDLPVLISPFDEQEAEVTKTPEKKKEVLVELEKPKIRKQPVKNRLLSIRSKIKKCNQVNITRMPKNDKEICLPVKNRKALICKDNVNKIETSQHDVSTKLDFDKKPINYEFQADETLMITKETQINSVTTKIELNKNVIDEEFRKFKTRCINTSPRHNKLIRDEETTSPKPKLKAEDILALLIPPEDKTTLRISENEPNIDMINSDPFKKLEVTVVDTNIMTTRSGRTILRPVRKLAAKNQIEIVNIESPETPQKADVIDRIIMSSPDSIMTTRSGRSFGRLPIYSPTTTKIVEVQQGVKRKRGRPPKIKPEKLSDKACCENNKTVISDDIKNDKMICYDAESEKTKIEINPINDEILVEKCPELGKTMNTFNCNMETETDKLQNSDKCEPQTNYKSNSKSELIHHEIPGKTGTENCKIENDKIASTSCTRNIEIQIRKMDIFENEDIDEIYTNSEKYTAQSDENDSDSDYETTKPEDKVKRPDVIAFQESTMTYKIFKTALDKCVWARGDPLLCLDEIQVIRNVDTKILVNLIIQCLKSDSSPMEKPTGDTSMEPLLTTKQKVVVGLLRRFENDTPNSGYFAELIACIEKYLLFNKKADVESLEALSRFYTALCRLTQDKQKVRMFISDLLYMAPPNKFTIIYTIITSWLNVLQMYNADIISGVGIDRVLVHIVMTTPINASQSDAENQDNCIGVMRNLFVTYYKYPNEQQCVHDLMMSLLESYMCDTLVQFEAAILILCAYNTAKWTYEKVQLIGELCKVSEDVNVVRNLLRLIANIAKKLTPDYKAKVYVNLSELFLHLETSKVSMNLENDKQLCLNG